MFSKAFLVAFLSLSVLSTSFARPTNDFTNSFAKSSKSTGNKAASKNTETCGVSFSCLTRPNSRIHASFASRYIDCRRNGHCHGRSVRCCDPCLRQVLVFSTHRYRYSCLSVGSKGGNNAGNGAAAGNTKTTSTAAAAVRTFISDT